MLWASEERIARPIIEQQSRYWFNAPLLSRYFLIPGSIVIILTMIGTLLTALVISREWERGTMEAMMATPATMGEILVGKLVPYALLGICSMVICFLVSYFWYEIPFRGSLVVLFAMGVLYMLPSLSIGLLISVVSKNQFQSAQMAMVASFLPAFLLSGFLFEIQNMPQWLQTITYVIPARYFVDSIQTMFLAGNVWSVFVQSAIGIFLVGIFFFAIVLMKSKKGLG
jgi:ABC-2 type transport system permease protein